MINMKEEKNTRIGIRISEKKKKQFYEICEKNGLCPSVLINRWIHRFILNSKKNKIDFKEIYSAHVERMVDYNNYKES